MITPSKKSPTIKPETRGKGYVRSKADFLAELDLSAYPDLMRVADIAEALSISKQVVYHLLEEGELDCLALGKRCTRVFKTSLLEYLERQLQEKCVDG